MRTIPLLLLGLLLTACGAEAAPRVADPAPTTVAPTPAAHVIPDDVPLTTGYPVDQQAELPDMGLEEPHRGRPIDVRACGESLPTPEHTDLVRAGWTNVEDGRARQLVTFADAAAATSYVDALLGAHRACPVREDEGFRTRTETYVTDLGEQSGAAATNEETGTGLVVTHVVRVGSAVLVSTQSSEGGAGPRSSIDRAVDADGRELAPIVAAMGRI